MNELLTKYKKLLTEFIAIKSVSADKSLKSEIQNAADWLKELFNENGFKVQELKGNSCNPIVYAEYQNGSKETILTYGHYDVQPADKNDGWSSEPFEMAEKDDHLYGRGVLDDKGQVLIPMLAIFKLIKEKKLGYNIKFLIEGNEESGNTDMKEILNKNKDLLKSDYVVVSDGEIYKTTPLIYASLRGVFNMKITLKTGNSDQHSGLFGGAIFNAATVLANLVSSIVDSENNILIPGFEDKVDSITPMQAENSNMMEAPEVKGLIERSNSNFFIQTGLKPTIQVTGINAGYTGQGFNNIIPGIAEVRLNIRTVPSQDVNDVEALIKSFIKENLPNSIECEIEVTEKDNAVKLDIDFPLYEKAKLCLENAFKNKLLIRYEGGSIPFVKNIKDIYDVKILLIPLGNDENNAHGPNENYSLDIIEKGFAFSLDFFRDNRD